MFKMRLFALLCATISAFIPPSLQAANHTISSYLTLTTVLPGTTTILETPSTIYHHSEDEIENIVQIDWTPEYDTDTYQENERGPEATENQTLVIDDQQLRQQQVDLSLPDPPQQNDVPIELLGVGSHFTMVVESEPYPSQVYYNREVILDQFDRDLEDETLADAATCLEIPDEGFRDIPADPHSPAQNETSMTIPEDSARVSSGHPSLPSLPAKRLWSSDDDEAPRPPPPRRLQPDLHNRWIQHQRMNIKTPPIRQDNPPRKEKPRHRMPTSGAGVGAAASLLWLSIEDPRKRRRTLENETETTNSNDLWMKHQRRNQKTSQWWACIFCPHRRIFTSVDDLFEHGNGAHQHYFPTEADKVELERFLLQYANDSASKRPFWPSPPPPHGNIYGLNKTDEGSSACNSGSIHVERGEADDVEGNSSKDSLLVTCSSAIVSSVDGLRTVDTSSPDICPSDKLSKLSLDLETELQQELPMARWLSDEHDPFLALRSCSVDTDWQSRCKLILGTLQEVGESHNISINDNATMDPLAQEIDDLLQPSDLNDASDNSQCTTQATSSFPWDTEEMLSVDYFEPVSSAKYPEWLPSPIMEPDSTTESWPFSFSDFDLDYEIQPDGLLDLSYSIPPGEKDYINPHDCMNSVYEVVKKDQTFHFQPPQLAVLFCEDNMDQEKEKGEAHDTLDDDEEDDKEVDPFDDAVHGVGAISKFDALIFPKGLDSQLVDIQNPDFSTSTPITSSPLATSSMSPQSSIGKRGSTHVCHQCHKSFRKMCDLRKHSKGVHTKTFPCPINDCPRAFGRKQELIRHQKGPHRNVFGGDEFACEECGKVYARKEYVRRHMRAKHGGDNGKVDEEQGDREKEKEKNGK